jgi:AcrR family transcriptional regulator
MNVNPDPAEAAPERLAQRYRSPLRAERAADTRRRILTAAIDLFTGYGFGGTTVAAIAERAGVAPQTIYATFGTKAAILRALLEQIEGDAGAAEWRDRIAAADDPAVKLEAFAHWSAAMFATSKAILAAAAGAFADPAIIELRAEGDRHRRLGVTALVDTLAHRGDLVAGLSRRQAVDRAWILTGVEIYLAATDGCGWTDADYADWLTRLLVRELLPASVIQP